MVGNIINSHLQLSISNQSFALVFSKPVLLAVVYEMQCEFELVSMVKVYKRTETGSKILSVVWTGPGYV